MSIEGQMRYEISRRWLSSLGLSFYAGWWVNDGLGRVSMGIPEIEVDGDTFMIPAGSPLGYVLVSLDGRCVPHAFPDSPDGVLLVLYRFEPDGGPHQLACFIELVARAEGHVTHAGEYDLLELVGEHATVAMGLVRGVESGEGARGFSCSVSDAGLVCDIGSDCPAGEITFALAFGIVGEDDDLDEPLRAVSRLCTGTWGR